MIRESLRPYIAAQFKMIQSSGIPIARPLAFDFPEDELVHTTCALDEDCPAETQQMCEYQLVSLTYLCNDLLPVQAAQQRFDCPTLVC